MFSSSLLFLFSFLLFNLLSYAYSGSQLKKLKDIKNKFYIYWILAHANLYNYYKLISIILFLEKSLSKFENGKNFFLFLFIEYRPKKDYFYFIFYTLTETNFVTRSRESNHANKIQS